MNVQYVNRRHVSGDCLQSDNIARLYEMSDSPERRQWLDKLLAFMDDNKTPIAACPTISKNPLDLYALYLHVKERGGFMEVTLFSSSSKLFVVLTCHDARITAH